MGAALKQMLGSDLSSLPPMKMAAMGQNRRDVAFAVVTEHGPHAMEQVLTVRNLAKKQKNRRICDSMGAMGLQFLPRCVLIDPRRAGVTASSKGTLST